MSRIALITNGVVVDIISADIEFARTLGFGQAVECESAGIDWTYDGETFAPPPSVDTPQDSAVRRVITRLAFRNRFTLPESIALEVAGLDNPESTPEQRQGAAMIRVMQRMVSDATFIDLDDTDTKNMVMQLESMGLLAPGRALQILTSPITSGEQPLSQNE